jgi:hypothetical protein
VFFLNHARQEVACRIVDEKMGVIEVLGESLPGWLADPTVPTKDGTWFVPLPVRLTFGTFNGPALEPVVEVPNFYSVAAAALYRFNPNLKPFLGRLGSRVPEPAVDQQIRLTFSHGDPSTGRSHVGPYPWLILFDDPENPLRRLVLLPAAEDIEATNARIASLSNPAGFMADEIARRQQQALGLLQTTFPTDNFDELVERARPHAKAALSAPAILEDGSLTLDGPRTVPCNGRVSAVEVKSTDEGFVTEVSFAGDTAPLPGMDGPVRTDGPVRLLFGIDTDRSKNE